MKKILAIISLILVVILAAFGISKINDHNLTSHQTIKIGALLSLTGEASAWGENARKAIELATEQINDAGGINNQKVEIVYEDTSGDPKKAVSAFQSLMARNDIVAIIGPLNQTEVTAVIPLINQTNTPTLIPGYVPLQNRSNLSNPIIIWMDAEIEAGRLAQYIYNQGIRNVAVVGTLDSWESTVSKSFSQKFQEIGGKITDQEIVQPDSLDMKLPITKAVSSSPQAIFLGTYYQFFNSVKTLHDQKYIGNVYSIEVDDYLAGQTAGLSTRIRFIAPDFYSSNFINLFNDKYGMTPGLPSGQSYDTTNILFSFLKKSEDHDTILENMKNFTEYDGVSGKIKISKDGRTFLPTALFEIDSAGKIKKVSNLE